MEFISQCRTPRNPLVCKGVNNSMLPEASDTAKASDICSFCWVTYANIPQGISCNIIES